MPKENWAFISEYTIYKYMIDRYESGLLKLKPIYIDGKPIYGTPKKVLFMEFKNSMFPDIDDIKIDDNKGRRSAEVKFLTSSFEYHSIKKYQDKFKKFIDNKGFIIILKHDYYPKGLLEYGNIDIYQLDDIDFIYYMKENFDRLLYAQINHRLHTKYWLMYAGRESNFYKGYSDVPPAKKSNIWCAKKHLSSMDLNVSDIIVFVKVGGTNSKHLQKYFYSNKGLINKWYIERLYICEAESPILERHEFYYRYPEVKNQLYLWPEESKVKKIIYDYVFKFKILEEYEDLSLDLLNLDIKYSSLVQKLYTLFTKQREKEINSEEYNGLILLLSKYLYSQNQKLRDKVENEDSNLINSTAYIQDKKADIII